MNISYAFSNNLSIGFDLTWLWVVLAGIWSAYRQKNWQVQKFLSNSTKTTQIRNKSKSFDLGLFSVFVLNRVLHLGIVYVVFKTISKFPISVDHPEILASIAAGVGGYIGGITMWIFYLSSSILKESD